MSDILIIDHGSTLVKELESALEERGYNPKVRLYTDLTGISAADYNKIIFGGGNTPIGGDYILDNGVGIDKKVIEEERILRECQEQGIPVMGTNHGAQTIAHLSGGTTVKLAEARQGYSFKDYKLVQYDPILKGIEITDEKVKMSVLEWHGFGIKSVGADYHVIVEDGKGGVQIARHNDSPIYIVQSIPYAKRPKDNPQTNAKLIFENFLNMPAGKR